jgi:hypothetical protein
MLLLSLLLMLLLGMLLLMLLLMLNTAAGYWAQKAIEHINQATGETE